MTRLPLEEIDRRIAGMVADTAAKIATTGRPEIVAVFGTEDSPGPGFTYTVGLTNKGRRELVVFGLPPDVAGQMLNVLADLPDEPLGRVRVWGELDVDVRAVDDPACAAQAEVNLARRIYGAAAVRVAQVCWPDPKGRYPGEAGCDYDGVLPLLAAP